MIPVSKTTLCKYILGVILLAIAILGYMTNTLTPEQTQTLIIIALVLFGIKEIAEANERYKIEKEKRG